MFDKIVYYVLMFFIYSAIGWAVESTYRTIGEYITSGRKVFKIINTGFLYGPICPIYGTGALVFEILVLPFSSPPAKRWWLVILIGAVFADIVEYLTSFLMEKLFHARWWDYSEEFLNIKGRICFKHTCYWGLFSFLFCYLISPVYTYMISFIPQKMYLPMLIVILIIFVFDLALTVKATADVSSLVRKLDELKVTINSAADAVKITTECIVDDAHEKYDDWKERNFGSSAEKFASWRSDVSAQLSDLKQQLETMAKKGGDRYPRRTRRIFSMYLSKRSKKTITELERKWNEIKTKVRDNENNAGDKN